MSYFTMPRGGKRTGAGRKKGSVGTLSTEAREQLRQRNFNPLERLMAICDDERTDIRLKVKILIELCQYYYPKFKPVNIDVDEGETIEVRIVNAGMEQLNERSKLSNSPN